jgi:pimeloyl-ACP methyl ester carboxylesterase
LSQPPAWLKEIVMLRTVLQVVKPLLLLLNAASTGVAVAVGAFFAASLLVDTVPLLLLAGALALLLVTGLLAWSALAALLPQRQLARRALAAAVAGGTLLLAGWFTSQFILAPMAFAYVPKEPSAQTRFWDLHTGSRLAYVHLPAMGAARPTPVINLHGGPGAPTSFEPSRADQQLAAAGFDVYHYDQIGAGASARLDDVRQYSVERHVADLEAIRAELGAERLILLGGSWGGTLAAHYLAAYPERVERVVFSSPGPIWAPAFEAETGTSGNASAIIAELATLRFVVAYGLQQINPQAAVNLASDQEMSAFFQQVMRRIIATDVAGCGAPVGGTVLRAPPREPKGFGYYANMLTVASVTHTPDPRPSLAELPTPALILRGECDRMRPELHEEYRSLLPNATLLVLDGVGHAVDRSPAYIALVTAFVREEPLPIPGL